MASTEHDYEIQGLRKQIGRDRRQGNTRTIWSRGRVIEANIHGPQLHIPVDPHYDMRDTASGKLWFVPGYSKVKSDGSTDPVRSG